MRRNLNDAWLRAQEPPASGRLEIRDTETVGLVLRVTPAGVMTWSVRTRTKDGKQTRPKLGTYPAMGIAAARKAARKQLVAVEGGADPVAEEQRARAAKRDRDAALTVAAALAEWRAARETHPEKPWSDRYAAEVARLCDKAIIPKLGKRALRETTRGDWTKLIGDWKRKVAKPKPGRSAGAPAKDGAGAAAWLYRLTSSFLGHAEAQGWVPLPLLPRKGAQTIAPPVASRARVLTDGELALVWRAAEAEAPKLKAFVRLLVLTACRESEAADIATGECDLAAARWTIPAQRAKNGQALTVPLHPLAVESLRQAWPPHGAEAGEDWKLLGRIAGSGFRGFGSLKRRLDARMADLRAEAGEERAALPAWTWHDLRRTARTGMTRLGVPRDHAEAALNHVSHRTPLERTYDRHDRGPEVAAALERWQAHVATLVRREPEAAPVVRDGAVVVSLNSRRMAAR